MQPGFMELLDLQGDDVLISKSELLDKMRTSGRVLTDRTLTYYIEEGLIPKAARFGRSAAFPAIASQLLAIVVDLKKRGVSSNAVRELVALWKPLVRERQHQHSMHLATLEEVARQRVESPEASAVVPWLVDVVLNSACPTCVGTVAVFDKRGELVDRSGSSAEWINFMLTEFDPTLGKARVVGHVQLTLPGMAEPDEHDPRTVVLGSSPDADICYECPPVAECPDEHEDENESAPELEEVLA